MNRKLYSSIFFIFLSFLSFAQKGVLKGLIKDDKGKPLPDLALVLVGTSFVTETKTDGSYLFPELPVGSYTLSVADVTYKSTTQNVEIRDGEVSLANITVNEARTSLDEVTVIGLTETGRVNKQPFNVVAIDAAKLHNTTLDVAQALDRVSGIRVRESGGVGSSANLSLNGFTGNQVRYFLDGIPMDNFGSSFQINNIPINFAERVEVYKGVVPVWLGSDALGGAINIVTDNKSKNYIDASYSFGSFNTHRSAVNAAITSKGGFTAQINAFQNYSDNNYKVTLDVADINTGAYERDKTVRRFHDRYHNETVVANVGVLNQKWADKFLIGITLGQNYREIQTGARMASVFGAWHTRGNIVMPTLKYLKNDFGLKGLKLIVNANYNFGTEQSIDTAFRRYDWYGNYKEFTGAGGERNRTMYKYSNNTGIVTTSLFYTIAERHSIAVNNVFNYFNRKGEDPLDPESLANKQPQLNIKNISGLSYQYNINDKFTATAFGKLLYQNAHTRKEVSQNTFDKDKYVDYYNTITKLGYGVAASYYVAPQLQAKFSYEKSNRLPENTELFGDVVNQESNFDLKPETSNNINFGLNYTFSASKDHVFWINATGIYRNANDFIYYKLNNNQSKTVADNLGAVKTTGGEFELKYSYKSKLSFQANLTYQNIRNKTMYEQGQTGVSVVYNDRIPNMPYLYGNAGVDYYKNDLFTGSDRFSIGYNLLYVNSFYLYWPSLGSKSDKLNVPTQLSHDINLVYTLKNGRYNIGLECKNITDAKLVDNFSLQKPGRAFYLKLRYFLSK